MRALALLLLLLPTAACEGGGGAVSLRWRLIDLQSGVGYDPKTYDGPDGVCRCGPVSEVTRPDNCSPEYGWTVHRIEVELTDEATGLPVLDGDPRLVFECNRREGTTPYIVPPSSYGIRIKAIDPTRGDCVEGQTPPTVIRTIRRGDIVNLDVVEVGILYPPVAGACP